MMRRFRAWTITLLLCAAPVRAQKPDVKEAPPPPINNFESLSARQAVREGNARLVKGDADEALEAYARAKELRPGAPQIPFVEGLAELKRKDYDKARDLFREAAASDDAALAADAQYAIGASYHMEALDSKNPEEAIEHLEAAMERYRDVLARRPDHALARESDYKAASMRRQLKQLLEQQKQQQQQNQDGDKKENQENQDQQQSDSQDQQKGEQQEQDEQSQSEKQEGEDQQQQQSADQEQDGEQDQAQKQQSESEQEKSESEEQQEAQASQQEEEISREQAERRLREMMQSIRDKQKQRRRQAPKVPIPPVEKDW